MEQRVIIDSADIPPQALKTAIEQQVDASDATLSLETVPDDASVHPRAIESVVLVALISNIVPVLLALIGLSHKSKEITLIGQDGWTIKVPADTPPDTLERLVSAVGGRKVDTIAV